MAAAARKIGLIVNPIAGMGGSTALKGTDGGATLARARELGAEPLAPARARRALARLAADAGKTPILAAPGCMGADVAKAAGFEVELIDGEATAETSAEDTRRAAVALREGGASLILFAGGDGTARDILDAVGSELPILGIPAGVKMQSAVFAVSPEAAGQLAALLAVDRDGQDRLSAGGGHGYRRGGLACRPGIGPALWLCPRALRTPPDAESQGRRAGGGCDAGGALPRDRRGDGAGSDLCDRARDDDPARPPSSRAGGQPAGRRRRPRRQAPRPRPDRRRARRPGARAGRRESSSASSAARATASAAAISRSAPR